MPPPVGNGPQPRRVDLSQVRPQDLEITFGLDSMGLPIHPDPEDPGQPRWFAVRARFDTNELLEMLAITERVDKAQLASDAEGEAARQLLNACSDVGRIVKALIEERYPGTNVPPLSIEEAMFMLGLLVGNPAGPAAVAERGDADAAARHQEPLREHAHVTRPA